MPELIRVTRREQLFTGQTVYIDSNNVKEAKIVGIGSELALLSLNGNGEIKKFKNIFINKSDII